MIDRISLVVREVGGRWEDVGWKRSGCIESFSHPFPSSVNLNLSKEGEATDRVEADGEPPTISPKVDLIWIQWLIAAPGRFDSCHVR